jgi:iron complex outermembrane receptor protein
MKKIVLAGLLLILFLPLSAQTKFTLRGLVLNGSTLQPLAGAHVRINALNRVATCDSNGVFVMSNIPAGKHMFCFSFVGYRTDSVQIKIEKPEERITKAIFPVSISIDEVSINATRSDLNAASVPSKVEVITDDDIQNMPIISTDELLSLSPGINASRNYGIYNKTGDVTMRGLNRNVHTLILMDGVPLSLLDGSASNWNRIDPDQIERIEILKGPNSSLYGGNAMAGVINLITRKPQRPLAGTAKVFYGTYNTYGGDLMLNGRTGNKDSHYFYGSADAFFRYSSGYMMVPDDQRDSTDTKLNVEEYNVGAKVGYVINKNSFIEGEYRYSYDNRGAGKQIYELDGNYNLYKTQYSRLRYSRKTDRSVIEINGFFKHENYFKQNESLKTSGLYYFYYTYAVNEDYGIWGSWSHKLGKHHVFMTGLDLKQGTTDNLDRYHTSMDSVMYSGSMGFYGIFVQDMMKFAKDKLVISVGLRGDAVNLKNAEFNIASPGITTEFMAPYQGDFPDTTWLALSPRIGAQWNFNANQRIYLSWSRGFRAGTLSDMCRTGDVNKGFKLANPSLSPENIDNYEIGSSMHFLRRLTIEPAVFFSMGHNFQYFVGTGDSIYTTGTSLKPVIRRENIGEVAIYGAEIKCIWQIRPNIEMLVNYSYNKSRIMDYQLGTYVGKDLTGMSLIEVPEHMVFARFFWKNRFVNSVIGAKYFSKEWVDDENTVSTDPCFLLDLKFYHTFLGQLTTSLTIQNVLNNRFTDSKGMLSPGIFWLAECKVAF